MARLLVMFDRGGWRHINQALETGMAGEIRAKMAALRAAKEKMIVDLSSAIDAVAKEVVVTHADGLDAMKLPRAELELTKAEIREIREEFAPKSNGAPPGPLPDTGASSSALSATSAASATDPAKPLAQSQGEPVSETAATALAEPMKSWTGQ